MSIEPSPHTLNNNNNKEDGVDFQCNVSVSMEQFIISALSFVESGLPVSYIITT